MIIDLRKQVDKRVITIHFENDTDIDGYVDKILEDIKIVMKQRRYIGTTKIEIKVK